MAKVTVKLEGFQRAEEKLRKLGNLRSIAAIQQVVNLGAKELGEEAESRAPRGPTGNLKRAMKSFGLREMAGKPIAAIMLAIHRIAPHLHLVAFGTKEKRAGVKAGGKPTKKKALGSIARGFGPVRSAKGQAPNPFFKDAVRARRAGVRRRIIEEMRKVIVEAGNAP